MPHYGRSLTGESVAECPIQPAIGEYESEELAKMLPVCRGQPFHDGQELAGVPDGPFPDGDHHLGIWSLAMVGDDPFSDRHRIA
jgi:hypothetical protein